MILQSGIEALTKVSPNTYLVLLISIFLAKEILSITLNGIKSLRGNQHEDKDEKHKQEQHDALLCVNRNEAILSVVKDELIKQTLGQKAQIEEVRKQTKILEQIRANGHNQIKI